MTAIEVHQMLHDDPDFVYLRRYDYNIDRLLERYPEGCPDHVIAQALMITEEDVAQEYDRIVQKLRAAVGADQ